MILVLVEWLRELPKEAIVIIVGALPVSELRGAIPLALSFGFSFKKAFIFSVIGNLIPVIPILILLEPVSNRLREFKLWSKFFDWLFKNTRNKANSVQKYEALGLALFVAIPFPATGAWTGAVAASLFKIRFRYALIAIISGVIIAGVLVSLFCILGIISWRTIIK